MTGRACWLLASGEVRPPKRILALTFSVAAARGCARIWALQCRRFLVPWPSVLRTGSWQPTFTDLHGLCCAGTGDRSCSQ
ncbi:MAG: hypothetical protein ACLU37_04915 [Collinsella sp.]